MASAAGPKRTRPAFMERAAPALTPPAVTFTTIRISTPAAAAVAIAIRRGESGTARNVSNRIAPESALTATC
jgi:hypothetical protein